MDMRIGELGEKFDCSHHGHRESIGHADVTNTKQLRVTVKASGQTDEKQLRVTVNMVKASVRQTNI